MMVAKINLTILGSGKDVSLTAIESIATVWCGYNGVSSSSLAKVLASKGCKKLCDIHAHDTGVSITPKKAVSKYGGIHVVGCKKLAVWVAAEYMPPLANQLLGSYFGEQLARYEPFYALRYAMRDRDIIDKLNNRSADSICDAYVRKIKSRAIGGDNPPWDSASAETMEKVYTLEKDMLDFLMIANPVGAENARCFDRLIMIERNAMILKAFCYDEVLF